MTPPYDAIRYQILDGDNLSVWVAFFLTLIGIAGSVYTAQQLVPNELQSRVVTPWVVKLNKEFERNSTKSPSVDDNLIVNDVVKPDNSELKVVEIIENKQKEIIDSGADKTEEVVVEPYDCPSLFTFNFKEASIKPQLPEKWQKAARLKSWLDLHPETLIILEGYSSSTGTKEANLVLSYRRSKAARRFLVKAGISDKQLVTRAFGEDVLIKGIQASSKNNRRVSMRIDGTNECQNISDNQ